MSSKLQLDVCCLSCCGGAIWWTLTKERQAWCYLQVKLCDPCLSALSVPPWPKKALYKYCSFLSFVLALRLCANTKTKKTQNRVLEIENRTESNWNWKIQTDPALSIIHRHRCIFTRYLQDHLCCIDIRCFNSELGDTPQRFHHLLRHRLHCFTSGTVILAVCIKLYVCSCIFKIMLDVWDSNQTGGKSNRLCRQNPRDIYLTDSCQEPTGQIQDRPKFR